MLDRFRKIREPYRMFAIGGMTLIVLVVGKTWQVIESGLWAAFLAFLAVALYFDLREPVNYTSLNFDSNGFCHVGPGGVSKAAWSDVCDVFYVRWFEPFANQIDTEWEFFLKTGAIVTILVEWPDTRSFASAIQRNLEIVSKHKVAEALKNRGEGRWRCIAE